MKILKNVSLKLYSTMRLGGTADYLVEAKTKNDLVMAALWAEEHHLPVRVIGTGSNIIWRDEGFKGLLLINKISGFKKLSENLVSATYQVGAGENWDTIVEQFVGLKLAGVECMSLIPGTVGAAPVQNIGAYGQDLSQTLVKLEAYDRMEKDFVTITNQQCAFGYRTSRFKSVDTERFLIASITLQLSKVFEYDSHYADIDKYFDDNKITEPTLLQTRNAVIAVRRNKLPDPAKIANCGSFFGNPIIKSSDFARLVKKYPAVNKPRQGWTQAPYWELKDGTFKISAAWLIEEAGFSAVKDKDSGMSLWPKQNLVFINSNAKTTQDLLDFQQKITDKVQELFGIILEREPELLP
ncbi:MAG: UDP-N-acetylmuramate dehydrogenase [bacterium]|nr:UDP-N-acetylmuramate dehydrogenase [bacterium]